MCRDGGSVGLSSPVCSSKMVFSVPEVEAVPLICEFMGWGE